MASSLDRAADRSLLFRLTVGLALFVTAGVAAHALGLNGPRSWYWRWRELPPLVVAGYALPPLLAIMLVHRRWILGTEPAPPARTLSVLVLCSVALQLGLLQSEPRGFQRLHDLVLSKTATSYYTDAFEMADAGSFLASFHATKLTLHSGTHPPGPVLFYYALISTFGATSAPYAACAVLVLLSALVLPGFYLAAAPWLPSSRARLAACSLFALAPTLNVFVPVLDTVFGLAALALVACWQRALDDESDSQRWSVGAGAALFVATLLAYNVLAIGVLLLLLAGRRVLVASDRRVARRSVAVAAAVALAAFVALHLAFHLATGYRPIAAFAHALEFQEKELGRIDRPYLSNILVDLYGFFVLGAGVVALPLLIIGLARSLAGRVERPERVPFAAIAVATVLAIHLCGLLPGETARVWSFLYPYMLVPIGIALVDLSPRRQLALLALQWLFLVTAKANILFMSPY